MPKDSEILHRYLCSMFSERVELIIGTVDSLSPSGGEEWIISGDDLATIMVHLYEESDTIKKSMEDAMGSGVTDPLWQWFDDNHDLIVEEAWEHDWMELFSD